MIFGKVFSTFSNFPISFVAAAGSLLSPLVADHASAEIRPVKDPYAEERIEWNKPFKPFHVIANIYHVGTENVSAYLIVTPKGDILTDGGLPESVPLIEKNIRALGFDIKDVKILLNSHAHFDHAGGLAELKRITGAPLYASAADTPFLERGHITFGPSAVTPFPPVRVDHVVKEGSTVSLGGVTLTAHITPGHTPGCTTWTMPVVDAGVAHKVMFYCSVTVKGYPLTGTPAYPHMVQDFKRTVARLDHMDADIFLAPHGNQFDMKAKVARMKPGAPNPFIDAGEVHRMAAKARSDYQDERARQHLTPDGDLKP